MNSDILPYLQHHVAHPHLAEEIPCSAAHHVPESHARHEVPCPSAAHGGHGGGGGGLLEELLLDDLLLEGAAARGLLLRGGYLGKGTKCFRVLSLSEFQYLLQGYLCGRTSGLG